MDKTTIEFKKSPKLSEVEEAVILETLRATGGNKAQAARLLGVHYSTLYRKLKRMERKV